ncbi:DUF4336 domain-containing protein [Paucibacter sp. APW11]|uniref:DUF4336 domain-containing protein n=1 Tax=Roseateles aquae TaxID=3077235 RepID=A0ABU3P7A6_9BURK|nr:DUF4336 domain-containing protein [Paucibacter sp. APW11]MDT8998100.1 DUF4336 domain-containing protein [Paucibacter sp. APW11]
MLQAIAPELWHVQHAFKTASFTISSRMTVVRLRDGSLWLHSPVPINAELQAELAALGPVRYLVAPNKVHHLFLGEAMALYPEAEVWVAPGLPAKRKDLQGLRELGPDSEPAWREELDQIRFGGIPQGNEVVWFHRSTATLILTDLCQCWTGDLPKRVALYAWLTGVRKRLNVPRSVRLLVRDRQAARHSAKKVLQWPFMRVVLAHDCIIERDAHSAVAAAFHCFE